MSKYICYNGDIKLANEPIIKADNRSFNYGDGVFETIRCLSSKPFFFDKHYNRLIDSLAILKISLPSEYTEEYFRHQIERLLQKNRIYKGARVRLTVFRNSGGLYTPIDKMGSYIITVSSLQEELFALPANGLRIGIYTENKKQVNPFSHLKACNSLFYIMAGIWKKENNLDDCLILNQENRIIEGLSSNIFLVKDNILFASNTSCGCVDGTMRRTIIELVSNKLDVKQVNGFTEQSLLSSVLSYYSISIS